MSKRMSNEQLGAKLDTLVDLLTAQAIAAPASSTQTLIESPDTTEDGENVTVEVDAAYLARMNEKAADHATAQGAEVVLYARLNKAKETKLAYALRPRYDTQIAKQPSHIGPVGSFQP